MTDPTLPTHEIQIRMSFTTLPKVNAGSFSAMLRNVFSEKELQKKAAASGFYKRMIPITFIDAFLHFNRE